MPSCKFPLFCPAVVLCVWREMRLYARTGSEVLDMLKSEDWLACHAITRRR